MLSKLRERSQGESGFTLVELLVVMLIIGLLAAIAIPAFFNQKDKATDSQAKVFARTAETSMETYATDNGGVYNANTPANTVAALDKIEPTLNGATLAVSGLSDKGYTVTVTSGTGNTFSITRDVGGTTSLDCVPVDPNNPGGCPSNGNWG
jgi:type IV pilus assembly protein PilA